MVYDEGKLVGLCMQDLYCLCVGVTICATIVAREFDFYILTTVAPENHPKVGV